MICKKIIFSGHALQKMFSRNISIQAVKNAITEGEIIKSYPEDKPYPSFLIALTKNISPLHIVVAENKIDEICIVVTAYKPESDIWENNFKTRK